MAAITVRSGSDPHVGGAVAIEISGATVTGYDDDEMPSPITYYVSATRGGTSLRSQAFSPSSDGQWVWDNVTWPIAGSWTVALHEVASDDVVATLAVTVAA